MMPKPNNARINSSNKEQQLLNEEDQVEKEKDEPNFKILFSAKAQSNPLKQQYSSVSGSKPCGKTAGCREIDDIVSDFIKNDFQCPPNTTQNC